MNFLIHNTSRSKFTKLLNHREGKSIPKQNYTTTAKVGKSGFKLWKPTIAVLGGFGIYQYFYNKMETADIAQTADFNISAVQEIRDAVKGGWEVEEISEETWIERLIATIRLSLRVISILTYFTPCMITWPLTHVSNTFNDIWLTMLLHTFRACGPTFIKFGQWMATRPDLFPDELCRTMESLHVQGGIHSYEETRQIIREAFHKEIDELFVSFDPVPVASGAVAQVHRAKIQNGNEILDVAVKIRHPGIEKQIAQDLKLIQRITALIGDFEAYKWLNLEANVLTFSKSMKEQIDLRVEANNLTRFISNFKEIRNVTFPTPVMRLSHPLVLVETWEAGTPISEFFHQHTKDEKISKKLASLGVVLYLKMMLDNFLHSDLHPGNITVRLDKDGHPSLVVLDVGLVCKLKQKDRANLLNLFTAIVTNNGLEAAECMIEKTQKSHITKQAIDQFKKELGEFFAFLADKNTPEVEIGITFQKALELGKKYKVAIDPTMCTALIGTMVIEGLGRQLNPKLDFISESTPVLTMNRDLQSKYFQLRMSTFISKSADSIKEEVEQKVEQVWDSVRINDWF
jgi:aarF domain-containing kinase